MLRFVFRPFSLLAQKRLLSTSKAVLNAALGSKSFIDSNGKYAVTTYSRPTIVLEKGKGPYLWDLEGKKYIDFFAGIAVTALGHSNPEVAKIMFDQAKTLVHSSNLYHNLWTLELSKLLVEKTKQFGGMYNASKVFLCNSGTEANEAALKFARKYGTSISSDKTEFITFENSFHGRTFGSLAVTPNPKYQKPFAPLVPGVSVATPGDISSVESLISDKTCGVIIEPIQGEGGVHPQSTEFLVALKKLCQKHKALLIYDEIQCGLGRSGKLWAHSRLPNEGHPDILTMAKALGNGYPIGATMITEDIESVLKVGDHGTTFGGNPLGARIGCYVLSQIADKEFLDNVEKKSELFKVKLNELKEKFPQHIKEVRGEGLILGVECNENPSPVVERARQLGLLVITAGGNVIRIVPALNIDDNVIIDGLKVLEKAMEEIYSNN
ncbi:acetylornithine aminotransferase [Brettanomyces nanus]|uniref:Acetylornithine aminotransferase, mitochondrial n=1 Tax=Eeniella nana TaxID=13502 RepID=A0A875S8A9_EENNA|nr:acetylornithine aminotransferase [Brettanomyces nanus]QPG75354.1 acetylornithine aminotransferase [Brettanomyces nanus]